MYLERSILKTETSRSDGKETRSSEKRNRHVVTSSTLLLNSFYFSNSVPLPQIPLIDPTLSPSKLPRPLLRRLGHRRRTAPPRRRPSSIRSIRIHSICILRLLLSIPVPGILSPLVAHLNVVDDERRRKEGRQAGRSGRSRGSERSRDEGSDAGKSSVKSVWSGGSSFSVVGVFGSDGRGSTRGRLGEGGGVGAGRVVEGRRSGGGEGSSYFFSSCLFCSFGFDPRGSSDGSRGSASVEEDVGGGGLAVKGRDGQSRDPTRERKRRENSRRCQREDRFPEGRLANRRSCTIVFPRR